MKEFIKNQKVTYNLMSFTGYKALLLFSLLTEGPKSYEEICNHFINHPYLREKISIDTLRVYINSLKRIGCEVKRFRGEDKISRYVITAHPFELKMSDEEMQSVIKTYKSLVKNIDIKELLSLEKFFEKIGKYIKCESFINEIKSISLLKDINRELLEELIDCCEKKNQILIEYNSPNTGLKDIEILTDKIDISNGKIYLYGTGFEYMEYGIFLVSRIKSIKEIKLNKTIPDNLKSICITYELKTEDKNLILDENEKLIKKEDNKAVIELKTSNKFLAKQKFLEYGPTCKIIAPEDFKKEFITLLNNMKAGYYCD